MAQENLKKAVTVLASAIKQGEKSFADGVQLKDAADFIAVAVEASQVDWKAAIAEAKDRSEQANAELLEFVKTQFALESQTAELKVEAIVAALLSLDNVYLAFKK